jgi:hypothetical protein
MARELMSLNAVFLSASVPDPLRDEKYFTTGDTVAIRDAVIALLMVVLPRGRLVFGGHPAITPMVKWVADQLGAFDRVRMFQSDFFRDRYLRDLELFRYKEIEAAPGDREESLRRMRMAMIESEPFSAAFFIGGMEGVEAEYELLKDHKSRVPRFPVYTTGGAARILWTKERSLAAENPNLREVHGPELDRLRGDTSYVGLFTNLLERAGQGG